MKILDLVEQSKGWSSVEASRGIAENVMMGISEEELYSIPTAEYIHRRGGFLNRQLTVYHVAFHAFADLRNTEVLCDIELRTPIFGLLVKYCLSSPSDSHQPCWGGIGQLVKNETTKYAKNEKIIMKIITNLL